MENIKDYIFNNKKKVIIFLILLVLISFGIGYFVFAADDEYADKIDVHGSISKDGIVSGTPNVDGKMDECTDVGCDTSQSDRKVRNFDSVGYKISYGALINKTKTEEERQAGIENPAVYRTIYADIFIEADLNATLSMKSNAGEQYNDENSRVGKYIHARYKLNQVVATASDTKDTSINDRTFTFWINNIDTTNGKEIRPIILLSDEATTTKIKTIDTNAEFDINEYKDGRVEVAIADDDVVTVTGSSVLGKDYNVYLFGGPSELTNGNRTFATSIVLGLINDPNRGFFGKIAPTDSSFKLAFSQEGYDNFEISKRIDESYDYSENSGFTIKVGTQELPYTNDLTSNKNTNINDGFEIQDDFSIKFSEIVKKDSPSSYFKSGDIDIKIVAEKVFRFTAVRNSGNVSDSKITLNALDNSSNILATVEFEDIKGKYVGGINNKLTIYDSTTSGMSSKSQKSGEAVYNYGEAFYINNIIRYGNTTGGVSLSDFTNYIKIDNSAINVIEDNEENSNVLMINGKEPETKPEIYYHYGEWTTDYIKLSEESSSNSQCPKDISNFSKEQLMNLYGGPCVTLKTDADGYKKSDSILDTSKDENSKYKHGIMLVETVINNVQVNDKIDIKLKAMVKDNQSLVNDTYQVVTNSTAKYNEEKYYLSSNKNSDVDTMVNNENYKKSKYKNNEFIPHQILNDSIAGETIIVSAVKVSKPKVISSSKNSEKVVFDEFPITWEVETRANIPKGVNYNKAEIVVYLPKYLEYISASYGSKPIVPTINKDGENTILSFVFDSDTITSTDNNSDGNSIRFYFDTDRAFNTPKSVEQEVRVKSQFFIKSNSDDNLYSDISTDESRTTSHKITIYNNDKIFTSGITTPSLVEVSKPYSYNMKAYNNMGSSSNMELLYILPYDGDIYNSEDGSVVTGDFNINLLSELPSGYMIYYTDVDSKTILGNELSDSSINKWKEWTDYTKPTSNIKAIKIVSSQSIPSSQYFASADGITINITPKNNKIGDEYYNRFVIITKDSSDQSIDFVNSSYSIVSVYNRKISGFVFEDADYNGLYSSSTENTVEDVPIEIYKVSSKDATKDSNTLEVMRESDTKIGETTTDLEGVYSFRGLETGLYYVKYTFDCDKYTTTDKLVTSDEVPNSSSINSNANMLKNSCGAVSDIIELDDNNLEINNINLGIAVRKVFGVDLKKYITKVVVNSNKGTTTHDYDNETQVKIDIKNLKNTSFRVTYKFELKNSKYFPGYVNYIIETIPEGMTFNPDLAENDGWIRSGNQLFYTKLSNVLISPGDKYYFSIVLDLNTETAGDFINIISASDFKILGEDTGTLDFSNIILGSEENIPNDNNEQSNNDSEKNE